MLWPFLAVFIPANMCPAQDDTRAVDNALDSSNLPIIIITTENNAPIPNEPKLAAHMGIIYNGENVRNTITDPFNEYDGLIGIELRGNASAGFPKRPYLIETRQEDGSNNNVSLLGMPKENDWILRSAYIDKTLMRDALGMHLSRSMGRWACRTRHCELVINGEYLGVYLLLESIKPDKNRLNITKMTPDDNAGDAVTGAYIWEVAHERPNSFGERRELKYPKKDDVTPEQLDYIRRYDDDFREVMTRPGFADSLTGYHAWIDVASFIDEILIQEATKNSDAYGWSSYFHKDRLKKLNAGPVWDFDQAMSNSTWAEGYIHNEFVIEKNIGAHPAFWKKLFKERAFKNQLAQRWSSLRQGAFHTDAIFTYIDSTAAYLNEAQERNFAKWPILGVEIWRSPPGATERDTYEKEVAYLKDFIQRHLQWMDENLVYVEPPPPEPVDLQKGLVGFYNFDGAIDQVVPNLATIDNKGPNGVVIADPSTAARPRQVPGKSGSALHFSSSHQAHIDLGQYDPSAQTDQLAISCWIKWNGLDGAWHGIAGLRDGWDPATIGWSMVIDVSSGGLQFETNTAGGKVFIITPMPPAQGDWTHVVLNFDGNYAYYYFDAQLVADGPMQFGEGRSNSRFRIGAAWQDGNGFNGAIDEFRMYHRLLSTDEIAALYNNPDGQTNVKHDKTGEPTFALLKNYPNPFNPTTTIEYTLSEGGYTKLTVYNVRGEYVCRLIDGDQSAGTFTVTLDAADFPAGVYLLRLDSGEGQSRVKKILLVR